MRSFTIRQLACNYITDRITWARLGLPGANEEFTRRRTGEKTRKIPLKHGVYNGFKNNALALFNSYQDMQIYYHHPRSLARYRGLYQRGIYYVPGR